jgi:drug/metabolite transporter (DMT)-like permease
VKLGDLAALMLLGVLWGASCIFIMVAVPEVGPLTLMGLRVGLAASALILYAVLARRQLGLRGRWRQFLFLGAVNSALPFTLIAFAEIQLTASLASILNSTTVLFSAVVSAIWLGTPITVQKVIGVVTGLIGVAALVGWDPIPLNLPVLVSVGAMLLASLSYALGANYVKRNFSGVPPLGMAIGQQTAATGILIVPATVAAPVSSPSDVVIVCVLGLAVFSTAAAYLLYFRLIENVGPTSTVTVTFLVPVFGMLFGVVLLGEPFGWGTLAGLGIILLSVALVTGMLDRRKKP